MVIYIIDSFYICVCQGFFACVDTIADKPVDYCFCGSCSTDSLVSNRFGIYSGLCFGEYFHCFEGVENSLKYIATGEKGDITSTYNKDVPLVVKLDDAGLDFIEQYQGNGFILFFQECEDTEIKILGSYCKAMILKSFL